MARSGSRELVCLRVRVATRLAWLDLTQADFARAIDMDKSSLSRALRAETPRPATLQRIALGLGLQVRDLTEGADKAFLLKDHPAIDRGLPRVHRVEALRSWYHARWKRIERMLSVTDQS